MWASDGAYLKVCHEALRPLRPALHALIVSAFTVRHVRGFRKLDEVRGGDRGDAAATTADCRTDRLTFSEPVRLYGRALLAAECVPKTPLLKLSFKLGNAFVLLFKGVLETNPCFPPSLGRFRFQRLHFSFELPHTPMGAGV